MFCRKVAVLFLVHACWLEAEPLARDGLEKIENQYDEYKETGAFPDEDMLQRSRDRSVAAMYGALGRSGARRGPRPGVDRALWAR